LYPLPSTSGAGSEKAESAYQSLALVQPPIAPPYWTPWNSRKSCYRKLSELFSALCHGCRWTTLSCRWTTSVFFRKVLTLILNYVVFYNKSSMKKLSIPISILAWFDCGFKNSV